MDPALTLAFLEERIQKIREEASLRAADLVQRFVLVANKAGCQVEEVKDLQEAGYSIAKLARSKGVQLIQVSSTSLLERLALETTLEGSGITITGPDPEGILKADLGISDAGLGIAETGSLLIHLDAPDTRLITMLPPIHIALLQREDLVESLEEGLLITRHRTLHAQAQGQPSYISWVTGPSRTGDIEHVLTIGAHGPKELFIILVPRFEGK